MAQVGNLPPILKSAFPGIFRSNTPIIIVGRFTNLPCNSEVNF